ncbi:MAG: sodium:dicarboxylate symporter [Candidatus Schekmanbacteria bacterium RBG_13_48_7]|uniref:Sodium:dicarboxylate symporter n=1 Tax=Candidatus Schekmanbacteria bacterium RBG_13_48_7 TaxID=1817878 RepID=A0A1F7RN28_9BACT|nr:MAG: sodium:dicarboxylate symporter [Candidatus Schekmanbacteria bacterium RBG_13_48_7]
MDSVSLQKKHQKYIMFGILTGIIAGVFLGWYFPRYALKIRFFGDLFLNSLRMIIIPLIVASMIMGVARLGDIRKIGKAGGKTIFYYMVTTGIAVLIGIILVNIIQPGKGFTTAGMEIPDKIKGKTFSFIDVILGFIPPNIFEAMAKGEVLPLIIVSLVFGGVLTTLGESGKTVISFFDGINEAVMKMVMLIMYFAPIGIFSLIAAKLASVGGGKEFTMELMKLGKYSFTVILGLLIHGGVVLVLILFVAGKRDPWQYIKNMVEALTTAFSTASSSATLPITMECVQEKNNVSPKAASMVLPLGATINMDGTALYESVAAIFIAQAYGYDLTLSHQVIIFFTATLAAVGAAGIPEAGLVTMVIVLQSVHLPLEGVALILSIDWFLDRCRTTVNVWGDAVGAAVIDQWEFKEVKI